MIFIVDKICEFYYILTSLLNIKDQDMVKFVQCNKHGKFFEKFAGKCGI